MADVSKIKLPNNVTYNIKDATARSQGTFYGTCSTAAGTAAKVVSVADTNFALSAGVVIGIKFTYSNTASNVTLNVNRKGAKSIYYNTSVYTGNSDMVCGSANKVHYYMYDGTYWVYFRNSIEPNGNIAYTLSGSASGNTWVTTLTPSSGAATTSTVPVMGAASSSAAGSAGLVPAPASRKQASYLRGDGTWNVPTNTYTSAYCTTAAATAAKVASCTDYALLANSYVHVTMKLANTSATALTLNINSKGAKPIYINGTASSVSNYTLPAGTYLVYYDGTNYYFETNGSFRTGGIMYDLAASPAYSSNYTGISILEYAKISGSTDKFPILWATNTNNHKNGSGVCLSGMGLTIVAGGENVAQEILNNAANKSGTSLNGGTEYISPQTEELILAADDGISAFTGSNSSVPNARLLSNDSVIVGGTSSNSASPGANSLEFGINNTASGANSLAFGSSNTVSGNFSGCIGTLNQVTGTASYAIGSGSSATGNYSLAVGDGAKSNGVITTYNSASGGHALAFGYMNTASGHYSVAIGRGATASNNYAIAIGSAANKESTASGNYAISLGCSNTVSGTQSMSIGNENSVSSNGSYAFGLSNTLSNTGDTYSMAFGRDNISTGVNSYALGGWNTTSGELSAIFGDNNTNNTAHSFILGTHNTISQVSTSLPASYNFIVGSNNTLTTSSHEIHYSVAMGKANNINDYGIAFGDNNTISKFSSNTIYSRYSGAIGNSCTVSDNNAYAIGQYIRNSSRGAFVCGRANKVLTANTYDNASTTGDIFAVGNGYIASYTNGTITWTTGNAFRVTYAGAVYAKAAYNSSGADYAEFIKEWYDGNPENEDRVGYMVTIGEDGKLHKANEGDYIIGITSGNPSVIGNSDEDYFWMYERDEFNRPVYEEVPDMEPKLDESGEIVIDENGDTVYQESTTKTVKRIKIKEGYDSSLQDSYIERKDRPEWDYVGMRGIVPVRDDGSCIARGFCKCGGNGIATYTSERGYDTYYVIERINETTISVEVK